MKSAINYTILSLLLLLCNQRLVNAQENPVLEERLRAQRTAFYTEKMSLTSGEAEKFWPVYNDYTSRKDKIDNEIKLILKYTARNSGNISTTETQEMLANYVNLQKKEHELFLEYHKKFLEILSPQKVLALYAAETQFRQYLLEQIRERREQRKY